MDPAVVTERYERLRAVVERSARRRHEARVGRTEEVLVEGPSKTRPELTSGRTRQNKLVHFSAPAPPRPGCFADVDISGAGAHYLLGELVAVQAGPARRERIPVVAA